MERDKLISLFRSSPDHDIQEFGTYVASNPKMCWHTFTPVYYKQVRKKHSRHIFIDTLFAEYDFNVWKALLILLRKEDYPYLLSVLQEKKNLTYDQKILLLHYATDDNIREWLMPEADKLNKDGDPRMLLALIGSLTDKNLASAYMNTDNPKIQAAFWQTGFHKGLFAKLLR